MAPNKSHKVTVSDHVTCDVVEPTTGTGNRQTEDGHRARNMSRKVSEITEINKCVEYSEIKL